jgi:glycosyltransferase involved in cell wall biosynthesis
LRLQQLSRLDAAIAYTEFGGLELAEAGLTQAIAIIPHGIDLDLFRPVDQWDARRQLGIPDGFVVLLNDANSSRKRQDLAIRAFAAFARDVPDAWLLIHSELNSPWGWDLAWLCRKAGVLDQTIFTGKHGKLTDDKLRVIYSCADVYLSASMGEGWGFGAMEAMACGLPVIAPNWAAVAEWANDAALLVDCDTEQAFAYVAAANQEGGVVRPADLAQALRTLHQEPAIREHWRERGLACVAAPQFRWDMIAAQFEQVLLRAIGRHTLDQVSADLAAAGVTR